MSDDDNIIDNSINEHLQQEQQQIIEQSEMSIQQQKARDLLAWYDKDPDAAVQYIRKTINSLYIGIMNLQADVGKVIEIGNEARSEGKGAFSKIKLAKQAESMMKEISVKHKPFFDMMNTRKYDVVAALMFTVKDEYVPDMANIIGVLINTVKGMKI